MGTDVEVWARKIAGELAAKEQASKVDAERFVEEQRLRKALVPQLWHSLREALRDRCKALNGEVGKDIVVFGITQNSEASIRTTDRPRHLRLRFDAEAQRVHWECGAGKGEYLFRLNSDTTVVFETSYRLPYTPDEVSETLLDKLLQSQF
jgi:hypothetical protein